MHFCHAPKLFDELWKHCLCLQVDYTGFSTINAQRFGQKFVGRVANPHDMLTWAKSIPRKCDGVVRGVLGFSGSGFWVCGVRAIKECALPESTGTERGGTQRGWHKWGRNTETGRHHTIYYIRLPGFGEDL